MKKFIVFILLFSYFNVSGQKPVFKKDITRPITEEAKLAKKTHSNLYEIVIRMEDMILMLKSDVDSNYISEYHAIFYEDLLKESIKLSLAVKLENIKNED